MHRESWQRIAGVTLAAVAALLAAPAGGQISGENVNMVSGTEWPGGDPFLQRQNEPTIAVSSANPQHLMAGANDYRSVDIPNPFYGKPIHGDAWLGVFKSLDGGQTWKSHLLEGYPRDPHCQPKPASPAAPDPSRRRHHKHCQHPDHNLDATPALCGLEAAADPVMRAGTDGMFYLMGIGFLRDKSQSRLFVARFIDQNNREGSDPIQLLDTRIVARSDDPAANLGKTVFIDKPWLAVDVPRGNQTCTVPDPQNKVTGTKTIAAGTVYAAWAQFTPGDVSSDIMFAWSADCGASWTAPRKLNTVNSTLNQGVSIAIEPITGRVYVSWRRLASGKQGDAIMVTRSEGRKKHFAAPRAIARLVPFDLGQGGGQARTQSMPSMAISSDGATASYAHIVWQGRSAPATAGGPGLSRIFITSAKVFPRPTGDDDDDDPEDQDDETRVAWTAPQVVPTLAGRPDDDAGHTFSTGHQYMPSLTFGQGRLVLAYYDTRYDHTRRYFAPRPLAADGSWAPDGQGKFYVEELGPIGDLASAAAADRDRVFGSPPVWIPDPSDPAKQIQVYVDLNDGSLTQTRHTVDVRVGMAVGPNGALPGLNPSFSSVLVTQFPFGVRGDEGLPLDELGRPLTDGNGNLLPLTAPSFGTGGPVWNGITIVAPVAGQVLGSLQELQQLQFNPPGYPLFKGGTTAFLGDYLDVQGLAFVPGPAGGWAFNLKYTAAPVFHAAWTSNQDVRVPPFDASGVPQWEKYVPLTLDWHPAGGPALYDGGAADAQGNLISTSPTVPACGADTSAFAGSRDQNIYTSRITDGLRVSTPQNAKLLIPGRAVGFVIAATNTTPHKIRVAFEAPTFDPSRLFPGDGDPAASYAGDPDVLASLEADVAPFSSVHRTLFVKQRGADSARTIRVSVRELCPAPPCRSGSLAFNPPIALNTLLGPPGAGDPNAREEYSVSVLFPSPNNPSPNNPSPNNPSPSNLRVSNPSPSNPSPNNPSPSNPSPSNPSPSNPSPSNPSPSNLSVTYLGVSSPSPSNPSPSNPSPNNPSPSNPSPNNASLSDSSAPIANQSDRPVSDLNYTVRNDGNTTASYHLKILTSDPAALPSPLQMILTRPYRTPAAVGCQLSEVTRDQVIVNVPDVTGALVSPASPVRPAAAAGDVTNATLSLAPGEVATLTLRAFVPLAQMMKAGGKLAPAAVPASVPDSNTVTYADWGAATGTRPVKTPTFLRLDQGGASTYAYLEVAGGTRAPGATGLLTFVRTRGGFDVAIGSVSIEAFGGDTPSLATSPQPGDTITAYYAGDATYAASAATLERLASTTSIQVTPAGVVVVVSGAASGPAPTGSVAVSRNGAALGSFPLSGGGVTLPLASVTIGDTLVADYSGDSAYQPSSASHVVGVPTALVVTHGGTGALPGDPVAFQITLVAPFYRDQPPSGPVRLLEGGSELARVVLGTGDCSRTAPNPWVCQGAVSLSFPAGSHSLQAVYDGDTRYEPSTASVPLLTVPARVQVSANVPASTVTVTVSGGAVAATGTVLLFHNGAQVGGPWPLSSGLALIPVPGLAVGDQLRVDYGGDQAYPASTSGTVVVPPLASAVGIVATASTSVLEAGVSGNGITPTGSVTFTRDGVAGGSVALAPISGGAFGAAAVTPPLVPGETLVATYPGDASHTGSTSPPFVVQRSLSQTGTIYDSSTATLTVQAATGIGSAFPTLHTPAGFVDLQVGGAPAGAVALSQVFGPGNARGSASLAPSPPVGRPLQACFRGDTFYLPSCAVPFTVTGWSTSAPLPDARRHAAAVVLDGQLYVVGGHSTSLVRWNAAAGAWEARASLPDPTAATLPAIAAAAAGRIYLFTASSTVSPAWSYDPATDAWTAAATPAPTFPEFTRAVVAGGRIFLVAGNTSILGGSNVVEYDPVADAYAPRAPLPVGRYRTWNVATELDGKVYLVGGAARALVAGQLDVYDPAGDTWTALPSQAAPNYLQGAVGWNGRLFVFGGEGGAGIGDVTQVYDPAADAWIQDTAHPLPTPRYGSAAAFADGTIWVIGGHPWNGTDDGSAYRFLPD